MTDTTDSEQRYLGAVDLDDFTLGQITLLELTVNRELKEFLPAGEIVTFNDVVAQFQERSGGEAPRVRVPLGIILQSIGLVQLRATDPEATWEDAGKLKMEVTTPKVDAAAMVTAASTAATEAEDPARLAEMAASGVPLSVPPPPGGII